MSEIRFEFEYSKPFFRGAVYDLEVGKQVGRIFADPFMGLANLDVEYPFRRRGIGTRLLLAYTEAIKSHTPLDQVRFTCAKSNLSALSFYVKLGFTTRPLLNEDSLVECVKDLK